MYKIYSRKKKWLKMYIHFRNKIIFEIFKMLKSLKIDEIISK